MLPWGLPEPLYFPFLSGKHCSKTPTPPPNPLRYLKLRDGATRGQSLSLASCEKAELRFLKHVKALL